MSNRYAERSRTSSVNHALNIATIISSAVISIKLVLWGLLSLNYAALIMIGVVICLAIGKAYTKLALAGVAVYLLVKSFSGTDEAAFYDGLTSILSLLFALLGLYIIVRAVFGAR